MRFSKVSFLCRLQLTYLLKLFMSLIYLGCLCAGGGLLSHALNLSPLPQREVPSARYWDIPLLLLCYSLNFTRIHFPCCQFPKVTHDHSPPQTVTHLSLCFYSMEEQVCVGCSSCHFPGLLKNCFFFVLIRYT